MDNAPANVSKAEMSIETFQGSLSIRKVSTVLQKLQVGTHQTLAEAIIRQADDCIIAGSLVAKKGNELKKIMKIVMREILPGGGTGCLFALFLLGSCAKEQQYFALKEDDILLISQPVISKSCLINLLDLLDHPYEFQIIVGSSRVSGNDTKGTIPVQLVKLLREKNASDLTSKQSEDFPSPPPKVRQEVEKIDRKDEASESKSKDQRSPIRRFRKLFNPQQYNTLKLSPELLKVSPVHCYTRLKEISTSCTRINVIGVIVSVEDGCKCHKDKEHLFIYLQDETSCGKNFVLNLISSSDEIPPLHERYILRALDVLVQADDNGDAIGWVKDGKLVATVDCDMNKKVVLQTCNVNPALPEKDEHRINELRVFANSSAFQLFEDEVESINLHLDSEAEDSGTPVKKKPKQSLSPTSDGSSETMILQLEPDFRNANDNEDTHVKEPVEDPQPMERPASVTSEKSIQSFSCDKPNVSIESMFKFVMDR